MLKTIRHACVAGLLVSAAACGGTDLTSPSTVAGTYTLRTVNNLPLPWSSPLLSGSTDPTYKVETIAETITLGLDSKYVWTTTVRTTSLGVATIGTASTTGVYSVHGANLKLGDAPPSWWDLLVGVTIGPDSITISGLFGEWVYKR
jgi:hypothetical protein